MTQEAKQEEGYIVGPGHAEHEAITSMIDKIFGLLEDSNATPSVGMAALANALAIAAFNLEEPEEKIVNAVGICYRMVKQRREN